MVCAQVVRPQPNGFLPGDLHIGIVIAGHDRDGIPRAQRAQPVTGLYEFLWQRDVCEIAGDDGVVRCEGLQVTSQCVEEFTPVFVTPAAPPRQITQYPLSRQLPEGRPRRIRQVRVGEVREAECRLGSSVHAASLSLRFA